MNWLGSYASFDNAYWEIYQQVDQCGFKATPRGYPCRELRPASFTVDNARAGIYNGRSRRLNYRFLAIEAMSYIAGWGGKRHAELMCAINGNMKRFVNPETGEFDGPYGPALSRSFHQVVELLRRDSESRQAVMSIWSPGIPQSQYDVPCTLNLHVYRTPFYRTPEHDRQNRLGMTASMRSNDLNWGTPYDVASFCFMQCILADLLGWDVGRYTHYSGSLHLYETTRPSIKSHFDEQWIMNPWVIPHYNSSNVIRLFEEVNRWMEKAYTYFVQYSEEDRRDFEFVSALEVQEGPTRSYWKNLGDMVRFTWRAYDASDTINPDTSGV